MKKDFRSNILFFSIEYSKIMEAKILDNSIEYAKMIEVPISTCEYSFKRKRPFFRKKKVVKAVNLSLASDLAGRTFSQTEAQNAQLKGDLQAECDTLSEGASADFENPPLNEESSGNNTLPAIYDEEVSKKERRFKAFISAQVVAIFALISAIILTNLFWENSGMNTLFKSVFQSEDMTVNELSYDDFSLTLPIADVSGVTLENGAIAINGEYSLYPVCDGKVSSVERAENGTYTLTVEHSNSFSSVIEGLDMVYFSLGEEVSRHMPIGYVKNSAKVFLYNGASLLTDYATVENSIVFNK